MSSKRKPKIKISASEIKPGQIIAYHLLNIGAREMVVRTVETTGNTVRITGITVGGIGAVDFPQQKQVELLPERLPEGHYPASRPASKTVGGVCIE